MATIKTKNEWFEKNKKWHALQSRREQLRIDITNQSKRVSVEENISLSELRQRLSQNMYSNEIGKELIRVGREADALRDELDEFDKEYGINWYGWWRA